MDMFEEEKVSLDEQLEQTIEMRKNEIYNIEKITSIEETYYMQSNIIDGLQRDYRELTQSLQVVIDDNFHLKAIKEVEDRSYEKKNM